MEEEKGCVRMFEKTPAEAIDRVCRLVGEALVESVLDVSVVHRITENQYEVKTPTTSCVVQYTPPQARVVIPRGQSVHVRNGAGSVWQIRTSAGTIDGNGRLACFSTSGKDTYTSWTHWKPWEDTED